MENDSKKLNLNELEKISGGKVVELKDGKYMVVNDNAKFYDTKKEAQDAETREKTIRHHHLKPWRSPGGLQTLRPIPRANNQEIKVPSAVPLKDTDTLPSSNPDTSKND